VISRLDVSKSYIQVILVIFLFLIVYFDFQYVFRGNLILGYLVMVSIVARSNIKWTFKSKGLCWIIFSTLFLYLVLFTFNFMFNDLTEDLIFLELQYSNNSKYHLMPLLKGIVLFPILEEFFFRGIIMEFLLNRISFLKALIFSSIIFSLAHFATGNGLFYTLISGLLFGYIYGISRFLSLSIIVHSFNNILFLIISPVLGKFFLENLPDNRISIYIVLIITCLFLVFFSLKRFKRNLIV